MDSGRPSRAQSRQRITTDALDRQRRHGVIQSIHKLHYDFQQFALDHLLEHLQQHRQHDIILVPYPFGQGISGALISDDEMYYIVYDHITHPIHQVHIVLHEIAHMVLNHPLEKFTEIAPQHPLSQLGDEVRFRSVTDMDIHEIEAEVFVQTFQQQIFRVERQQALLCDLAESRWLNDYYKGMGVDL